MAGRLIAVWLVLAAAVVLTGLAAARLGGPVPAGLATAGAALAVSAGILTGRGRLQGQSPGVRDNASGIVAALAAAAATQDQSVGIVITGGEEFGLIGARIMVRERPELFAGCSVVNFDTLDDRGTLRIVAHDAAGQTTAAACADAFASLGLPVSIGRLPLGILVDSLPFARAGASAVTVARLDWTTLRHLHTAGDSADGCSFETAMRVGEAAMRVN